MEELHAMDAETYSLTVGMAIGTEQRYFDNLSGAVGKAVAKVLSELFG
jgi:hypothetical protein